MDDPVNDLLYPEEVPPTTGMDSLQRYFLWRIVQHQGPISLDVTDMIHPHLPMPKGRLKFTYGAYSELGESYSGEAVPLDKISRLEVTLSFEPEEERAGTHEHDDSSTCED